MRNYNLRSTDKLTDTLSGQSITNKLYPQTEFGSKEEITNEAGELKWLVPVQRIDNESGDVQQFEIIIWSKSNPLKDVPALTPIKFTNVRISYGYYIDNNKHTRKYWNLLADEVKKA